MIRGVPSPQPSWLKGPYAQAVYSAAREASQNCDRLIWWDSPVATHAANAAMYVQAYLRAVHEGRPVAELAEMRQCARGLLASFLLVDDAPGTIRPDGLDADIARLCDVPAIQ